ncbi:MAG: hypothetical protein AAFR61_04175 [Bacteroidota bacterium]
MKKLSILSVIFWLSSSLFAQISNVDIRVGADVWKLSYTYSSAQVNCALCPQIIAAYPEAEGTILSMQDSVVSHAYTRGGLSVAVGASILWPGLRAELQITPSMRRLATDIASSGRYANRNISALIGVNPMQFYPYAGRFYLGDAQKAFLDLSDLGIYAQFSYDAGFEEFVRSTTNIGVLGRWQPTVWTSDQQRVGISLRLGGRMWLMGNQDAEGPFVSPSGLPKKVRPNADWFMGLGLKVNVF